MVIVLTKRPAGKQAFLDSTHLRTMTTYLGTELSLPRHFILNTVVLTDLNNVMENVCRLHMLS